MSKVGNGDRFKELKSNLRLVVLILGLIWVVYGSITNSLLSGGRNILITTLVAIIIFSPRMKGHSNPKDMDPDKLASRAEYWSKIAPEVREEKACFGDYGIKGGECQDCNISDYCHELKEARNQGIAV